MYRILLVEDDRTLSLEIKKQLEKYGNEVFFVTDFHDVLGSFQNCTPQLVLMDIMLPYKDGYYWTAEIRKISRIPVVFISSASDTMNIVMAINMGGDDFISKPVDPMVLNAKIMAILRRTYEFQKDSDTITFNDAILNLNARLLSYHGEKIQMTKNEFTILETLLQNRGKVVSRDKLMIKLWNDDCYVEENTLTVNVTRLRKKLDEIGLTNMIKTRTGVGYIVE